MGVITEEVARLCTGSSRCGPAVDLIMIDRNLLTTMIEKFQGGPVGLDTLAAAIGEDAGTVEDVYEPYLLKNGFITENTKRKGGHRSCVYPSWI